MVLEPFTLTISPSVLAIASPAVTSHRSAVSSCVSGGSPGRTMRTFALMFAGPLKIRELIRSRRSFSFHRASMSAAGQNIVLSVVRSGIGGAGACSALPPRTPRSRGAAAAGTGFVRTRPTVSNRISHALKPFISV